MSDRAAIYRVVGIQRLHEKAIHATLVRTVHEDPGGDVLPMNLVIDYRSDEETPHIGRLLKVTVSDV